jgi:serine/threonine protein phosphatase PrpC
MPRTTLSTSGVWRIDATDDASEVIACGPGEAAVFSRRAPDKASRNEDAALVLPLGDGALLLAVADGCGGMPAGDEASRRALTALRDALLASQTEDYTGALVSGFDAANRAVLDMRAGAGTTLAAAVVVGDTARVIHVGDSLALITGQRGTIRVHATPHSPTGRGLEAGLMTEEEAATHEDRGLVLNVVGSLDMSVELSQPVRLRPRDTVLLASDGLSDNVGTDEIVGAVRAGPCGRAVDRLANLAGTAMVGDGGHPDDLTILAYRPAAHRAE